MADVIKAIRQSIWDGVDLHLKMVLNDLEHGSVYFYLFIHL